MNILCAFTRKSLLANRTRTVVTIIGIILSMALITAVIEGAYSGQQFLIRNIEDSEGAWMVNETGLSPGEAEALRAADGVGKSAVWNETGWGLYDPENADGAERPYLVVESMGEGIEDVLPPRLTAGRLPENPGDLLLPVSFTLYSGLNLRTGDTLTLSLGQRVTASGELLTIVDPFLGSAGETIADPVERSYTVVGVY